MRNKIKKVLFIIVMLFSLFYFYGINRTILFSWNYRSKSYVYKGDVYLDKDSHNYFKIDALPSAQDTTNLIFVIKGNLILRGNAIVGFGEKHQYIDKTSKEVTLIVTGNITQTKNSEGRLLIVRRDFKVINHSRDEVVNLDSWGSEYVNIIPDYSSTNIICYKDVTLSDIYLYHGWQRYEVRGRMVPFGNWSPWIEYWTQSGRGTLRIGCFGKKKINGMYSDNGRAIKKGFNRDNSLFLKMAGWYNYDETNYGGWNTAVTPENKNGSAGSCDKPTAVESMYSSPSLVTFKRYDNQVKISNSNINGTAGYLQLHKSASKYYIRDDSLQQAKDNLMLNISTQRYKIKFANTPVNNFLNKLNNNILKTIYYWLRESGLGYCNSIEDIIEKFFTPDFTIVTSNEIVIPVNITDINKIDRYIYEIKKINFILAKGKKLVNNYQYGLDLRLQFQAMPWIKNYGEATAITLNTIHPTIRVENNKNEFSNNGNDYYRDLFTDYINTSQNKIFFRTKLKITGMPSTNIYSSNDFNLLQQKGNSFIAPNSMVFSNRTLTCDLMIPITNLNKGENNIVVKCKLPLANSISIDKKVIKKDSMKNTPDKIDLFERYDLKLTDVAKQKEKLSWQKNILIDEELADISPIGESVTAGSFEKESELFKVGIKGNFSFDNVNIIKLCCEYSTQKSLKEMPTYFIIYSQNSNKKIDVICGKDKLSDEEKGQYYKIENGIISEIYGYYKYSDFFDFENSSNYKNAFPDTLGKRVLFSAKAIKILDHNYFMNEPMRNANDMDTKLDMLSNHIDLLERYFNNQDACLVKTDNYTANSTFFTPSFASRIITSYSDYDVDTKTVNLYIRPAINVAATSSYQIIVIKEQDYSDGKNIENLFDKPITNKLNDIWEYDQENNFYRTKWLDNNGKAILFGSKTGVNLFLNEKLHFFVRIKSRSQNNKQMIGNTVRHSSINLDENTFYVLLRPEDFLNDEIYSQDSDGDDNQLSVHLNTRFTGDIRIPFGKSLKFSEHSNFSQKRLPNFAIDNNVHFIVKGKFIIDRGSQANNIDLGPSGLAVQSRESFVDNGLWGGIYVMDEGRLLINGAHIFGAYDGIVFYNNANNSHIENLVVDYCEIGIHLYNSYPHISGDFVMVSNNYLYGVKEDNMISSEYSVWKKSDSFKKLIANALYNHYDYYDIQEGIISPVGNN